MYGGSEIEALTHGLEILQSDDFLSQVESEIWNDQRPNPAYFTEKAELSREEIACLTASVNPTPEE